jgi:hypothetical protein
MKLDREEKAEYYSDRIEKEWNKMTKELDNHLNFFFYLNKIYLISSFKLF